MNNYEYNSDGNSIENSKELIIKNKEYNTFNVTLEMKKDIM